MDQFSFIANADVAAIESLYHQYLQNPDSVDNSWQNFFKGFEFSKTWNSIGTTTSYAKPDSSVSNANVLKEIEVVHFIRGMRARGHMLSQIDPLYDNRKYNPNLDLKDYNLFDSDLDTVFEAGVEVFGRPATLREIDAALRKIYGGKIGFEYQYIRDRKIKSWFRKKLENEFLNFKCQK